MKEGEAVLAELWPVGGKSALHRRQSMGREKQMITSFSTGPQSTPTHWKQTIFMLREPITVSEGLSFDAVIFSYIIWLTNHIRVYCHRNLQMPQERDKLARVRRRDSLLSEDRRGISAQ